MRNLLNVGLFAVALSLGVVLLGTAALAGEPSSQPTSAASATACPATIDAGRACTAKKYATMTTRILPTPSVSFCGQCNKQSDCGTCRCVGPSDGSCNECVCP